MQVAARRIATQRPARTAERFPGRQPKRKLEQNGDAAQVERMRRRQLAATHGVEACRQRVACQRQLDLWRVCKDTKRIRLVGPVEPPGTRRVAVDVMLAAFVILVDV